MSPMSIASKACGPESDLWALGVVMYQLLTGYTPFAASSPYLIFLKIKRAMLRVPVFADDDTLEVLKMLMIRKGSDRLKTCSGYFHKNNYHNHHINDNSNKTDSDGFNYFHLKRMPFFTRDRNIYNTAVDSLIDVNDSNTGEVDHEVDDNDTHMYSPIPLPEVGTPACDHFLGTLHSRPAVSLPMLSELCLYKIADAALMAAKIIADNGGVKPDEPAWVKSFSLAPPVADSADGKASPTPVLSARDRLWVLHHLNRRNQLDAPCLYRCVPPPPPPLLHLFWSFLRPFSSLI